MKECLFLFAFVYLIACVVNFGVIFEIEEHYGGDNISFFDPELDREHVETCAKMAAVHDDIMAMPMGYQSLVGDMGSFLSGGQKQHILLARAI